MCPLDDPTCPCVVEPFAHQDLDVVMVSCPWPLRPTARDVLVDSTIVEGVLRLVALRCNR